MGDRCYCRLWCKKTDAGKFDDAGFHSEYVDDAGLPFGESAPLGNGSRVKTTVELVELIQEEANYAGRAELEDLADRGVMFWGEHDEGGEYPAAVFASVMTSDTDTESIWCMAVRGSGPVVEIDSQGEMNEGEHNDACAYWRLIEAIEKEITG